MATVDHPKPPDMDYMIAEYKETMGYDPRTHKAGFVLYVRDAYGDAIADYVEREFTPD